MSVAAGRPIYSPIDAANRWPAYNLAYFMKTRPLQAAFAIVYPATGQRWLILFSLGL
jgi:hypothetical protein